MIYKYRIYCETEQTYVYTWAETEPTTCPNNPAHTINTDTIVIVDEADNEPHKVRTLNCAESMGIHGKFIQIKTADDSATKFVDNDKDGNDQGHITYIMKDSNGDTTTDKSLAVETHIDIEVDFNIELYGGKFCVPSELAGSNDDAWKLFAIMAPDIPEANGGSHPFVNNLGIKWYKGSSYDCSSLVNPKPVAYDPVYHSGKLRLIFKHPQGASSEFQILIGMYK